MCTSAALITDNNAGRIHKQTNVRTCYSCSGPAPAISRLGINPYQWGTECLSGDVQAGPATSFPQALGMVSFGETVIPWYPKLLKP